MKIARYAQDFGGVDHLVEIPDQEPDRIVSGVEKYAWDVPDRAMTLCGRWIIHRDRVLVVRTPADFETGVCFFCRRCLNKGRYGGMTREITAKEAE